MMNLGTRTYHVPHTVLSFRTNDYHEECSMAFGLHVINFTYPQPHQVVRLCIHVLSSWRLSEK